MSVQVVTLHPERTLAALESVVARSIKGFRQCGEALAEIKDRELYKETHRSWDAYCIEKWGLTGRAAYRKIEQAKDAKLNGTLRPQREVAKERQALARGETPSQPPEPVLILARSRQTKPVVPAHPRAVIVFSDRAPSAAPDLVALAADLLAEIEEIAPETGASPTDADGAPEAERLALELLLELLDVEPEFMADVMTEGLFGQWDDWIDRLERQVGVSHSDWIDHVSENTE